MREKGGGNGVLETQVARARKHLRVHAVSAGKSTGREDRFCGLVAVRLRLPFFELI